MPRTTIQIFRPYLALVKHVAKNGQERYPLQRNDWQAFLNYIDLQLYPLIKETVHRFTLFIELLYIIILLSVYLHF